MAIAKGGGQSKSSRAKPSKKVSSDNNKRKGIPIRESLGPKENIKYTYFAACGNYVVKGKRAPLDVWWSNNELGQQLWKELDNKPGNYRNLGPKNNGWIPFEDMIALLNDVLGVPNFEKFYVNWTYKWEIGTARYTESGLSTTIKKVRSKTQGNPPTTGFTREERAEYHNRRNE